MDIDEVLLVGGQSRTPAVRQAVREFFGKEPRRDINPDEVVAMGAALFGYSLSLDELKEEEKTAAEGAYAVALKDTAVAKKLLDEVQKLRAQTLDDSALSARLQALLAETEADGQVDSVGDIAAPQDADLPAAVNTLRDELQELRNKAGDVMHRITEELADELVSEGAVGSSDPAQANRVIDRATQRLTQHLESAHEASETAQDHLTKAEQHASARKVDLIDVSSHALGIASAGDLFTVLIEKNVPIPTERQRTFTTMQDNQSEVEIQVYQGASSQVSKNTSLGAFVLEGISPAPRMEPRIDVTFRIDEDGMLSVSARDSRSGAEQSIRVEDPLQLQSNDGALPAKDDVPSA